MKIEADDINTIYKYAIQTIDETPQFVVSPRGMKIKEHIVSQIVLNNPLDCLVTLKERKLNYRFAIIEKMEYLWGKHDANRIIAYNPNMKSYAGTYNYFDGNYAQRFNFWLDHIYNILKKDPDSRQAVCSIYDATARHQSNDIPCTLTLQFIIREEKLNLIVNMRSNDLLWGFPYDINAFCFLQEVMACWLRIEMGTYYHNVGSMHIYTSPPENYQQLINTSKNNQKFDMENPRWRLSYEDTKQWLPKFFYMEERMRRLEKLEPDYLPHVLEDYLSIISTKWVKNG